MPQFYFFMLVNNFPIKMLTTSITNAGTNHAIPSDERGKSFNNVLMLSGNICTLFKLSHKLKHSVTIKEL